MNKKAINFSYIIIFIFFLYIPTISNFFIKDIINSRNIENRNLSSKPELNIINITTYPQLWDNYYNDNLPYRKNIVNNWRNLHYKLLNESLDTRVIVGKNTNNETWLFYDNKDDGDEISFVDGRKVIDYSYLDETIEKMRLQTSKLHDKGINIYYIIGPNKSTIYSNYLPKQINVKKDYFLEVSNYLKNNKINNLFYSTDILIESGKKYETYYRTDTHWNDYGAYIYSREFLKTIYNDDILGEQEIQNEFINSVGRDLHNFIGLSLPIKDNNINVNYKDTKIKEEIKEENDIMFTIYDNSNYKLNETILLIGDSFTTAVTKHLSSVYKKVILLQLNKSDYDAKILDKYKPNKIFFIEVERAMPLGLNFEFIKDNK